MYSNNIYIKDDEVALAIQGQLAAVGIKLNITMLEIATALAKVARGEYEISKQGCAAATADLRSARASTTWGRGRATAMTIQRSTSCCSKGSRPPIPRAV